MSAKKVVWLHIGHGKTGTTAIQAYGLARGAVDPAFNYPSVARVGDGGHLQLFARRGGPGGPKARAAKVNSGPSPQLYRALAADIASQAPGVVTFLSAEQLAFAAPQDIARLCDTLAPFDLRVLYYIRRQDDLLESNFRWLQVAQPNRFSSPEDLLNRQPESFDFETRLRPWRARVGDAAVRLRLYHAQTCAADISVDLEQVMGLQPFPGVARPGRERRSLDAEQTRRLMAFDAAHPDRAGREAFLHKLQKEAAPVTPPQPFVSADLRRQVIDTYRAANTRLAKDFLTETEARLLLA